MISRCSNRNLHLIPDRNPKPSRSVAYLMLSLLYGSKEVRAHKTSFHLSLLVVEEIAEEKCLQ